MKGEPDGLKLSKPMYPEQADQLFPLWADVKPIERQPSAVHAISDCTTVTTKYITVFLHSATIQALQFEVSHFSKFAFSSTRPTKSYA